MNESQKCPPASPMEKWVDKVRCPDQILEESCSRDNQATATWLAKTSEVCVKSTQTL